MYERACHTSRVMVIDFLEIRPVLVNMLIDSSTFEQYVYADDGSKFIFDRRHIIVLRTRRRSNWNTGVGRCAPNAVVYVYTVRWPMWCYNITTRKTKGTPQSGSTGVTDAANKIGRCFLIGVPKRWREWRCRLDSGASVSRRGVRRMVRWRSDETPALVFPD